MKPQVKHTTIADLVKTFFNFTGYGKWYKLWNHLTAWERGISSNRQLLYQHIRNLLKYRT